jgi:hypothetical protein
MSDFWESFKESANLSSSPSGVDQFLSERKMEDVHTASLQALTDKGREKNALSLPIQAGTRVSFETNIGSILTYDTIPNVGSEGTVVMVRSAFGDITSHDKRVFVKWDDGQFIPIYAEHLRPASGKNRRADAIRRVVSSLGDLTDFFVNANGGSISGELIHKSTQDLWSFHKEGDEYILERLFNDTGEPLKN